MNTQRFSVVNGTWTVVRLEADADIPAWASDARDFTSITRTAGELSIVAPGAAVPDGLQAETGWSLIVLHGPLPFTAVGVLASLTGPLAAAGISLFAISTFDTDYIMVKARLVEAACETLRAAGHEQIA